MTSLRTFARAALAALALTVVTAVATTPSAPAFAEETEIKSGSFTNQNKRITGTWRIFEKDGKTFISLSDDFRTRRAPDLKIFFSPTEAGSVTGRNATSGSLLVAELESARGGQTYEIPAGTDLSAYKSVVIHCEQYTVLWGAGPLES